MKHNIHWNNTNPVITFFGEIDYDDIVLVNDYLIGHKYFDNMKYQIWDLQNCTTVKLNNEEIRIVAALDKSSFVWNKKLKIALVAKDSLIVNLCEKYIKEFHNKTMFIKHFFKIEDAKHWCENE